MSSPLLHFVIRLDFLGMLSYHNHPSQGIHLLSSAARAFNSSLPFFSGRLSA